FRELASFSQFSTDLDDETRQTIERGQRLTEILKQPQYAPKAIWQMYCSLLAVTSGAFDTVPLEKIKPAEDALLAELKAKHAKLTEVINKGDKPTDEQNKQVLKVAESIAKSYEVTDKPRAKSKETDNA
ncbi:MAG TPA: hypothetical protein VFK97_02425, partial [Candidatus Saccharimonadales bacterium]|nr:hypothetical protein [Candidatus Saccharimonadales bacterium]